MATNVPFYKIVVSCSTFSLNLLFCHCSIFCLLNSPMSTLSNTNTLTLSCSLFHSLLFWQTHSSFTRVFPSHCNFFPSHSLSLPLHPTTLTFSLPLSRSPDFLSHQFLLIFVPTLIIRSTRNKLFGHVKKKSAAHERQ